MRLIHDVTPSGRVRVLMTSLLDDQHYPAASFGALDHQRWRIEEAFKRLRHRLRLEAVTGLDYLALQQDLGARILADNLCTLLRDLDDVHEENVSVILTGCTRGAYSSPSSARAFFACGVA